MVFYARHFYSARCPFCQRLIAAPNRAVAEIWSAEGCESCHLEQDTEKLRREQEAQRLLERAGLLDEGE